MKNTKITYCFAPKKQPVIKVVKEGRLMARTPMKFDKTPSESVVLTSFTYTNSTVK